MSERTPLEMLEEARQFARQHLVTCCVELLQLSDSGILDPNGVVREVARRVSFSGYSALSVAEAIVKQEAMQFVVANAKS